jgi:hypothetical protein
VSRRNQQLVGALGDALLRRGRQPGHAGRLLPNLGMLTATSRVRVEHDEKDGGQEDRSQQQLEPAAERRGDS